MPPHVSVVIPTYNRAHQIHQILEALDQQTYRDFEVIVSNDGSKDNTIQVLQDFQKHCRFPLVIVDNPNGGRAAARSRGAERAQGELLIFFDDDCRPNPQSLEYHVDFHKKHPDALLSGPAIYDLDQVKTDFQLWRSLREHAWYPETEEPLLKEKAGLTGANQSVTKAVYHKIGGFKMGLNDAEDFEFAFRAAYEFHYPTYFWYKTWVYHDDFKSLREYVRRRADTMYWVRALFSTNPEMIRLYPGYWLFEPPKSWLKRTFYRFFTTSFALSFGESTIFNWLVPKKIRHKYYQWAIHANAHIFLPKR